MSALLLLVGITLAGCSPEEDRILVGTKGFSESMILGEITKQLVEENLHVSVKIVKMDGGTAMLHPALVNGEIDLYAEW